MVATTGAGDPSLERQITPRGIVSEDYVNTATPQARTAARGSQFLDYGFYVLYALLGVRLVLALIAAQSGNGFVRFISAITNPFYAPFKGIVSSPSTDAGNTLVIPIVIAFFVYVLLHLGINGLLRMTGSRKTRI
jgi:hypothetical protein